MSNYLKAVTFSDFDVDTDGLQESHRAGAVHQEEAAGRTGIIMGGTGKIDKIHRSSVSVDGEGEQAPGRLQGVFRSQENYSA